MPSQAPRAAILQHLLGIEVSLRALSESEEIVSDAVDAAVNEALDGVNYILPATTTTSPQPPWLRVEAQG